MLGQYRTVPRRALAATLDIVAIILAAALSPSCAARKPPEVSRSDFVLDTVCSVRVVGSKDETLLDEAFARLRAVDDELNSYKPELQVAAVNAAAGKAPVAVSDGLVSVMKRDLEYSRLSDGAFDPSVGPLVKIWGIGTDRARVPSRKEIAAALALVGWRDIVLDESAKTLFLKRAGMAVDLGSTTKGYAADAVAALLRSRGVKKAIIDLGGNVMVIGSRPDGKPWRVGLQDPYEERGSLLGVASLVDETMVTSGVYERFFESGGKRYHHILDTKTGYPVDNGIMSVTVIAPRSFDADGLTTTIFALGREKGMELARSRGVGAIIVDADRKVYLSPGLSKDFEITDPAFSYAE
jgi:FAD:protein FMN transferase